MTSLRRTLLLAGAWAAACLAGAVRAETRWDLPSAYPLGSFQTQNLLRFAAEVDKATAGRLKITVHPNAALFKAPEIKQAVQLGQAQIGEVLLANYANEWPLFGIDSLPGLADSYPQAMKLMQVSQSALETKLGEDGMLLLYSVAWPPQGIYVKKPIRSLAALKDVPWRAHTPATSRIAELVGALPVTVQVAELQRAVASGLIEAFMSSCATGYDSQVYDHLKYWIDARAWLPRNAVLVNKNAFAALDKSSQGALLRAAAEAQVRGWTISETRNDECLVLMKQKGMTILTPSHRLRQEIRQIGDTMLQEWLQRTGPEGQNLIEVYRRL